MYRKLAASIGLLATAFASAGWGAGFKTTRLYITGTERAYKLAPQRNLAAAEKITTQLGEDDLNELQSGMNWQYVAAPARRLPPGSKPVLLTAAFTPNNRPGGGQVVAEIVSDSKAISPGSSLLKIFAHIDECTARIGFDANGDGKIDGSEVAETPFTQRQQNYWQFAAAGFPLRGTAMPAGYAQQFMLMFSPDWSIFQGARPIGEYLSLRSKLIPSLTVDLSDLQPGTKIQLGIDSSASGLIAHSFSLQGRGQAQSYAGGCGGGGGGNANGGALDSPFMLNGKPYMITEIAPDIASLKIATPEAWAVDALLLPGATAPAWSRPDVLTRHIVSPADLVGHNVVLATLPLQSWDSRYLAYVQAGRMFRKMFGEEPVLVFFDDNIQSQYLVQQLAGEEDLPFYLVSSDYGNGTNMGSLLRIGNSGDSAVLVIDPQGKVLLHQPGTLQENIGALAKLLPVVPQPVKTSKPAAQPAPTPAPAATPAPRHWWSRR